MIPDVLCVLMSVTCRKNQEIAYVVIERPEVHNALNFSVLEELHHTLKDLDTQVVILTGSGEKAFISGADIHEMRSMTEEQWTHYCDLGHAVVEFLETGPYVTIAAVNGFAFGGGVEIALACDLIVASETAKLGMPEVSLGLIPSFGGVPRLQEAFGKHRANELLMTGETITADQAPFVSRVCPQKDLMNVAESLANEVLNNSFEAIMGVKTVTGAPEKETQESMRCFKMKDREIRMERFLKRKEHA